MDPSMLPGDEPGGTQERLNELERMLLAGERLMKSGNKATASQVRAGMVRTIFPHLQKLEEIEHSWNQSQRERELKTRVRALLKSANSFYPLNDAYIGWAESWMSMAEKADRKQGADIIETKIRPLIKTMVMLYSVSEPQATRIAAVRARLRTLMGSIASGRAPIIFFTQGRSWSVSGDAGMGDVKAWWDTLSDKERFAAMTKINAWLRTHDAGGISWELREELARKKWGEMTDKPVQEDIVSFYEQPQAFGDAETTDVPTFDEMFLPYPELVLTPRRAKIEAEHGVRLTRQVLDAEIATATEIASSSIMSAQEAIQEGDSEAAMRRLTRAFAAADMLDKLGKTERATRILSVARPLMATARTVMTMDPVPSGELGLDPETLFDKFTRAFSFYGHSRGLAEEGKRQLSLAIQELQSAKVLAAERSFGLALQAAHTAEWHADQVLSAHNVNPEEHLPWTWSAIETIRQTGGGPVRLGRPSVNEVRAAETVKQEAQTLKSAITTLALAGFGSHDIRDFDSKGTMWGALG